MRSILILAAGLFLGAKLYSYLVWSYFAEGNNLMIDSRLLIFSLVFLSVGGFLIGAALSYFKIKCSDQDIKAAGGGAVGASFLTGLCLGGTCIPFAAVGAILTIPVIIVLASGVKVSGFIATDREPSKLPPWE